MMTNEEIVSAFFSGADSGVAANMSIGTTADGGTFLMAYGHAVYAYRPPDGRFSPVLFTGWKGASHSTNQHLSLMVDKTKEHAPGRPGTSDVAGDPDKNVLYGISGDDKDYSTSQRSFRTGRGD